MREVVELLLKSNKTISTMESCTGGAVANEITNVIGSSTVFKFSAVTYSNEFKVKMGVDKSIIEKHTVYSVQTANEMSRNISNFTGSNYGIGITGQINQTDKDNKIYISVYDKDNDTFYNEIISNINASRKINKNRIVKRLVKVLETILTNENI